MFSLFVLKVNLHLISRMKVHDRVMDVKSFEVCQSCALKMNNTLEQL